MHPKRWKTSRQLYISVLCIHLRCSNQVLVGVKYFFLAASCFVLKSLRKVILDAKNCALFLVAQQLNMSSFFFWFCLCVCLFFCMSHPTYGYSYMNLSHTRPILTKCDHTKSIQANLNQTKLKQTKQDHTNKTKIQASPSLSCTHINLYFQIELTN